MAALGQTGCDGEKAFPAVSLLGFVPSSAVPDYRPRTERLRRLDRLNEALPGFLRAACVGGEERMQGLKGVDCMDPNTGASCVGRHGPNERGLVFTRGLQQQLHLANAQVSCHEWDIFRLYPRIECAT